MAEVDLFNSKSEKVGTLGLNDAIFGLTPNRQIVFDSVVNYAANQRQGTLSTKTRGEVSGGGRKPWKQKGTGRARQGSTRAPQWIHGGIAFGPKPRDFSYRLPKAIRRQSLKGVLSIGQKDGKLTVLDQWKLEGIKTRSVVEFLKAFGLQKKKIALVLDTVDETTLKSCRNIENLVLTTAGSLHPYQLLWADRVILTKEAVRKIEESLA